MKYALVDDNQIKVGPRDYHVGFFIDYLKTKQIDFVFPNTAPSETVSITETIALVPVADILIPEYNFVTEQLAGPFYEINYTLITGMFTVADVPIISARNKMKELIAAKRYDNENTIITITVQDTQVKVDTTRGPARDFWFQSYLLMNDNDTKLIKFHLDDVWLTLTKAEVSQILLAINNHVQTVFDWENQQIILVETCDKQMLNDMLNNL